MRLREQGRGEGCGCIEGPERLAVAAEAALAIAAAHITHVTRYATVEFNGPDAERVKRVLQRDVTENQMRHDQLRGIACSQQRGCIQRVGPAGGHADEAAS